VWNYDWRQPVATIADNLMTLLTGLLSWRKVDVAGHSLGGLMGTGMVAGKSE